MMPSCPEKKRQKRADGPTINSIKRAKYEAKQQRRREAASQPIHPRASWFDDRGEYAAFLSVEDVRDIKRLRNGEDITSFSDNRGVGRETRIAEISEWLEPFFDLKDPRTNKRNDRERLFISEGTEAVRMMIQRCTSQYSVGSQPAATSPSDDTEKPPPVRLHSILSKPATFFEPPTRLLGDVDHVIDGSSTIPPFKIIIANEEAMSEISGFPISRGAMACGGVPGYRGHAWLKELLHREPTKGPNEINPARQKHAKRLIALDAISNAANMGSIIRTAAAFSIDAIILSDDSCDAWYRQSVRVSLGHVATVPILRVADWERGLVKSDDDGFDSEVRGLTRVIRWLRRQMNIECFAAVVDDDDGKSFPPLTVLEDDQSCGNYSWCVVLGNEGNGICDEVIRECDKRITIRMASSVDSLSLPIAAGILMHGMVNRCKC